MPPDSALAVETGFAARLLRATGLALWLVAAFACIWEVLALQPPASPLHFGLLATPIAQLRGFSFALGTAALLVSLLFPMLYARGEGAVVALLLSASSLLHVAALAYAAGQGLLAVQLLDPRGDARLALYTRGLAHALTVVALCALFARLFRRGSVERGTHADPAGAVREPNDHRQHEQRR
jgi:hypothetical protein